MGLTLTSTLIDLLCRRTIVDSGYYYEAYGRNVNIYDYEVVEKSNGTRFVRSKPVGSDRLTDRPRGRTINFRVQNLFHGSTGVWKQVVPVSAVKEKLK